MTAAHVQTKDAEVGSGSTVDVSITGVAAGNHFYAGSCAWNGSGTTSLSIVTSSPSATWTNAQANRSITGGFIGTSQITLRGDYSENIASGSWTVTGNAAGSSSITVNVSEASGVVTTSSIGVGNAADSGSSDVASIQPGSVTPTAGSILYVTWTSASGSATAPTIDNSFTLRSSSASYAGNLGYQRSAQFSKDNVAASAVNPTVTDNTGNWQQIVAIREFLASGGGAAQDTPELRGRPFRAARQMVQLLAQ